MQLINGINLYGKMRKSLGSKRKELGDDDIATITRAFGDFATIESQELDKPAEQESNRGRSSASPKAEAKKTFASKIFDSHEFGYRRITIERPLRESYQFSDERINELRFADKKLNAPMKWIYESFGESWSDDAGCKNYGVLTEQATEIRAYLKSHFSELKEAQLKSLLGKKLWVEQKAILLKARTLQQVIGTDQYDDMNGYDAAVKTACQKAEVSLETPEKKQLLAAVSWKNPEAEKVIKKVHRDAKANPLYGLFEVDGEVVEYKPDGDLRDNESVALDPSQPVNDLNEAYFKKEVQPHVPDSWIDAGKKDAKDEEIGIVGYEIPFNRHFYEYVPPRDLSDIDADLDAVSSDIMELLQEVHS